MTDVEPPTGPGLAAATRNKRNKNGLSMKFSCRACSVEWMPNTREHLFREIEMTGDSKNCLIATLAALAITGGSLASPGPAAAQGRGQGSASAASPISFREGYQVPAGKRLLIDDVSVACTTVGTTLADFRTYGLSASALLHISYPPADCPEPLDSEGECHQLYAVATAKQNGLEPLFLTAHGRPAARLWAGRPFSAFADEGATLSGQCDGIEVNFPPDLSFTLRGSGRLIDRP